MHCYKYTYEGGDALPLDYQVNNHSKKFGYLLYEILIHLIQGLYVRAKCFLLTFCTIFSPFTYLLIRNIQNYFCIIIVYLLKNICCQFNTGSRKHDKIIKRIFFIFIWAISFENLASVLKLYFCNFRYSFS